MAMRALVLQGLPTTMTLQSLSADSFRARPLHCEVADGQASHICTSLECRGLVEDCHRLNPEPPGMTLVL
jgi:hypothetical protein